MKTGNGFRRKRRKGPPLSFTGRSAQCAYCRRTLEAPSSPSRTAATKDHIHPKHMGGTRKVWCCRQCNTIKGGMSYEAWIFFMEENPEWWLRPEFQYGTLRRV